MPFPLPTTREPQENPPSPPNIEAGVASDHDKPPFRLDLLLCIHPSRGRIAAVSIARDGPWADLLTTPPEGTPFSPTLASEECLLLFSVSHWDLIQEARGKE